MNEARTTYRVYDGADDVVFNGHNNQDVNSWIAERRAEGYKDTYQVFRLVAIHEAKLQNHISWSENSNG